MKPKVASKSVQTKNLCPCLRNMPILRPFACMSPTTILHLNHHLPVWESHSNRAESLEIPCTPSMAAPSQAGPSQSTQATHTSIDIEAEDNFLVNPEPDNEHVGVDEEAMYIQYEKKGPVTARNFASDTEGTNTDYSDESEPDVEEEEGDQDGDEEVQDKVPPNIPESVYDKDDPPMEVGSIYANMFEFKLALASHSVKHEFEYEIEKSEPGRYRAHCLAKKYGCPWRIHAASMADNVTIKVYARL